MTIYVLNNRNETKQEIAEVKKEAMENSKVQTLAVNTSDVNKYATIQEVQNIVLNMYPVGSIYISTNGINPGEYIGGTWEKYGEGKTIVGDGVVENGDFRKVFNLGMTGGEYEHKLTIEEIPVHDHSIPHTKIGAAGSETWPIAPGAGVGNTRTGISGGGKAHNNMQPYIVVSMWKRTN